jgi:hypothetical protein
MLQLINRHPSIPGHIALFVGDDEQGSETDTHSQAHHCCKKCRSASVRDTHTVLELALLSVTLV